MGDVPLAPLDCIGVFDLQGDCWPLWGNRTPRFVEKTRGLFASREAFSEQVFGGVWPERQHGPCTDTAYEPHLMYLVGDSVRVLDGPVPCSEAIFCCKYAAVAKDVKDGVATSARAIFALTGLNEHSSKPESFPLFSMEELLISLTNLRGHIYFVTGDLKNAYYQLKVPRFAQELFGIRTDNSNAFLCRVLPMGWNRSCGIQQSLSLGIAGARDSDESSLGMPESIAEEETPCGLIHLNHGDSSGVLAIIYDTFFLALESRSLAVQWEQRLRRNCRRMGVGLKYLHQANSTTFSGLDVRMGRRELEWRLSATTVASWKAIAPGLKNTPRALWRGLGFLQRAAQCMLLPRIEFVELIQSQASLARAYPEYVRTRNHQWWDSGVVDSDLVEELKRRILGLCNDWVSLRRIREKVDGDVRFIAVDATLTLTHIVELDENGREVSTFAAEPCVVDHIDEAEAIAMRRGHEHGAGSKILVLAGDNTSVSRAFAKGYSMSKHLQSYLPQRRKGQTVIFVDVPTQDNLADVETRPEQYYAPEEVSRRRLASFERMNLALQAWRAWPSNNYFARDDSLFNPQSVKYAHPDVWKQNAPTAVDDEGLLGFVDCDSFEDEET